MPHWKDLPPIAKFSIIAFAITLLIGLMSMGAQGYGVYYAVEFALPVSIDTIQGDTLWPSTILAGMAWSIGFLMAGFICTRIKTQNKYLIWFLYLIILWVWTYLVWWAIIALKVVQ
ncbi:MAG TPA: hypothetical protein VFE50_22565 [Cyclobacteriaceae bacterium]|nr:hypothetical protein [Cyclobacteriaceae bacterium]